MAISSFFTALDYIILAVIFISTIVSLLRGFTRELFSLIGWVLAIIGTAIARPFLSPIAREHIEIHWLADGLVLVGTFILILVGFALLSHRLVEKMKNGRLGLFDRLMGAMFGVARGLLIFIFAYFLLVQLVDVSEHPNWIKQAQLLPIVQEATTFVMELVPWDNLSDRIPTSLNDWHHDFNTHNDFNTHKNT